MRKALDHAGIGVQEMADYLGVSRNTVSTWLHDRIHPSRQTVMLWSLRTGVDLVWITSGRGDIAGSGDSRTGWLHRQRVISPSPHHYLPRRVRHTREARRPRLYAVPDLAPDSYSGPTLWDELVI